MSSCSWFRDFRARQHPLPQGGRFHRASARSTVPAWPCIVIAILENYQQADGSIVVPSAGPTWAACAHRQGRGNSPIGRRRRMKETPLPNGATKRCI